MPDAPFPFLDPSQVPAYEDVQRKQMIAQALMGAFQNSNATPENWDNMRVVPKRGALQNVSSLVTALMGGRAQKQAFDAQQSYMKGLMAPESAPSTATTGVPGAAPSTAPAAAPAAPPAASSNPLIPPGMDKRTANLLVGTMGFDKYAEKFLSPQFQPTEDQKMLRAAGITQSDPRYDKFFQDKMAKETNIAPIHANAGDTLFDPITHQPITSTAPNLARTPEGLSYNPQTGKYSDANGKQLTDAEVQERIKSVAGAKSDARKVDFSGARSDLLASLAAKGVSLPAGLRSRDQMASTLDGLIAKFPGMSSDEIADKIATGQVDFGAAKKETSTAAGQAGRVAIAVNELGTFGDQVLAASKAIPRGKLVPWNRLKQMTDAQISDPALINFKAKMQTLNNAYDQLAARGGTDAEKRAHIAQLFNTANSDEGVQTLVQALKDEGKAAKDAADKATQTDKYGRKPGAPTNAKGWVLHTDKNGNQAYVSPDGKSYEEVPK
jgi:hypothetical protein